MSDEHPTPEPPVTRRCAICGETASYGFGPPGGAPVQATPNWFSRSDRDEGERRWVARHGRPTQG